jgi:hypothetical protein
MHSAMDRPDDPIARAFQLATSGKISNISDIKTRLKSEGYSMATVVGQSLAKQIRTLIKKSKDPQV